MAAMKKLLRAFLRNTPVYDPVRGLFFACGVSSGAKYYEGVRGWYRPLIRPGDLVFDIGANVGEHTAMMLSLGARVVAVEPNPILAKGLRRRFWGKKVVVAETAIGSEVGTAVLHLSAMDTLSTLSTSWQARSSARGRFQSVRWDDRVTVAVTTMQALMDAHGSPAFAKIDVEGFEEEVVKGASRMPAALCFECNSEDLGAARRCLLILEGIGATRFCIREGDGQGGSLAWVKRGDIELRLNEIDASGAAWFGDIFAATDSGCR